MLQWTGSERPVQGRWQLVELCEALHGLTEQEELIEEAKNEKVLTMTILTKDTLTTEEMER